MPQADGGVAVGGALELSQDSPSPSPHVHLQSGAERQATDPGVQVDTQSSHGTLFQCVDSAVTLGYDADFAANRSSTLYRIWKKVQGSGSDSIASHPCPSSSSSGPTAPVVEGADSTDTDMHHMSTTSSLQASQTLIPLASQSGITNSLQALTPSAVSSNISISGNIYNTADNTKRRIVGKSKPPASYVKEINAYDHRCKIVSRVAFDDHRRYMRSLGKPVKKKLKFDNVPTSEQYRVRTGIGFDQESGAGSAYRLSRHYAETQIRFVSGGIQ